MQCCLSLICKILIEAFNFKGFRKDAYRASAKLNEPEGIGMIDQIRSSQLEASLFTGLVYAFVVLKHLHEMKTSKMHPDSLVLFCVVSLGLLFKLLITWYTVRVDGFCSHCLENHGN